MTAEFGHHYIAGQWLSDAPNGISEVENPSNGSVIGRAPNGSAGLAENAVMAARGHSRHRLGQQSAPAPPRSSNSQMFLKAGPTRIASLMARENGKVLAQARHEVAAGYGEARYYAGVARNVFGRTYESGVGKLSLMTESRQVSSPSSCHGTPPVTLLVRSVAPALAVGCSVVIKPAPQTPLTNAAVMACFDDAPSIPAGIVNSVNEHGTEVGTVLSSHPEIDVISFTGSSRTGKIIMANASDTIKHVSLELGGKAPALVFDDADLDTSVAEIRRVFALNGQMCTCISRILVRIRSMTE